MYMVEKKKIILGGVAVLGAFALMSCEKPSGEAKEKDVAALHERILTLDSHVDIHSDYTLKDEYDPGKDTDMKVDLGKMEAGGLDSAFFIVYVGQTERTEENYQKAKDEAVKKFNAIHRMTDTLYADRIGLAYSPDEVRSIHEQGRKVAMIGIENGYVIGKDLSLVEDYYKRGARYMTLAHNGHNDICDSAQAKEEFGDAEEEHGGVSDFGRQVIGEMNRLGMMVDISHVSEKCMIQAVALSKAPAIASHSGVRALADHARNLKDDQMRALAEKGGVLQLVAYPGFVKVDPARMEAREKLRQQVAVKYQAKEFDYEIHDKTPEYKAGMAVINKETPMANVQEYVDHIDYAVKIMGIDHVGISSDFDGGGEVIGWFDATETANVTKELLIRGYSEEEIGKIWGGNLLRVWAKVDEIAASLQ